MAAPAWSPLLVTVKEYAHGSVVHRYGELLVIVKSGPIVLDVASADVAGGTAVATAEAVVVGTEPACSVVAGFGSSSR